MGVRVSDYIYSGIVRVIGVFYAYFTEALVHAEAMLQ
jgi:hypothetical protein